MTPATIRLTITLALLACLSTSMQAQKRATLPNIPAPMSASPQSDALDRARTSAALAQQKPLYIENKGQWDRRSKFLLRTGGLDTWITDHGVVYDLYRT